MLPLELGQKVALEAPSARTGQTQSQTAIPMDSLKVRTCITATAEQVMLHGEKDKELESVQADESLDWQGVRFQEVEIVVEAPGVEWGEHVVDRLHEYEP